MLGLQVSRQQFYAASEGIETLLIDRMGPGGQAGGSSKIENFIGFPAGLSGAELATRGVLQMLKFGAQMAAPVGVVELKPASTSNGAITLTLDCGSTLSADVVLIATEYTGEDLTRSERVDLKEPGFTMSARRSKPISTMTRMLQSSEVEIQLVKP